MTHAPRAEKFCYECGAVIPRAAATCWSCSAPQPALPETLAPPPPPAEERDCSSCGRRILARAELCVHCGVRQLVPSRAPVEPAPPGAAKPAPPPHTWDASHILLGVGAALVVMVALSSLRAPPPPAPVATASASVAPPAPPAEPTETEAWAAARRLVTTELRAPPNVEFPSEHQTTRLGKNRFEVSSYFEMPNTSGDVVRTRWTVALVRRGEAWQIERLEAKN